MIERDEELKRLFEALAQVLDETQARQVQERIWAIWSESDSAEANLQLSLGNRMLEEEEYTEAVHIFSVLTDQHPDFAEGWNKLATAHYMRGEFKTAMDYIAITLRLEGRHFGALSGLLTIQLLIEDHVGALQTVQRLLRLQPHHERWLQLRDEIMQRKSWK